MHMAVMSNWKSLTFSNSVLSSSEMKIVKTLIFLEEKKQ